MYALVQGLLTNVLISLGGIFIVIRFTPLLAKLDGWSRQAALGLLFGLTAVGSMLNAFPIADGIYGDMRNAIIAVAAIAGGPGAGLLSALMAMLFRLWMGGQVLGALAGIALTAALAVLFSSSPLPKSQFHLAFFGLVLAAANASVPFIGLIGGSASVTQSLHVSGIIFIAGLVLYPLWIMGMTAVYRFELARTGREARLASDNHDLAAGAQRSQDIFDMSCIPMAWVDLGTRRFLRVNSEYERFTGYSAVELSSMTLDQLSVEDARDSDISTLKDLLEGTTPSVTGERQYRTKSGSIRWGSRTLTATLASDGTRYAFAIVQDITERRRAAQQIRFLAEHDPLTTLTNRYQFNIELGTTLSNGESNGASLLLMDLDNFKVFNDTKGHAVGDQVLLHVADVLRSNLERRDLIGRIGGDEFAVVRPNATLEEASRLGEKLLALVAEPVNIGGQSISVSASMGIAVAPLHGDSPADLLKKADIALYASKRAGKGIAHLFDPQMEWEIGRREDLKADLASALARAEFELEYQPILDVNSLRVCAFEALMRWKHPTRGRVSPLEFIPLLEENGSIIPVGNWALERACLSAATWPEDVAVAVNVSVRQFEPTLPLKVAAALSKARLPGHRLQIEVTESVLMQGADEARQIMDQIRQLGVKLALDDFGTGFSSLSYLHRFPVDKLKIDRSFVQELGDSPESRAIVRAIIMLGRSLKMRVTAEGVETKSQLDRLRLKGCDEAQGYYFSRPVSESGVGLLLTHFNAQETNPEYFPALDRHAR